MFTDDTIPDERIESLTLRHLRDFRRTQDLYLDLLKRQTEMTGRLARDVAEFKLETDKNFNELRGDILLLENRSITAAGNDEFFRRRLAAIEEELASLKGDVGLLQDDMGSMKTDMASMKIDMGSVKTDMGSMKTDMGSMKTDMGSVQEALARIESALGSR